MRTVPPLAGPVTDLTGTLSAADKQAPSFYRYKVGDIQVTVVSDGKNVFKLEDSFITNAKKDEVNAALEKAFMPRDIMSIYFAPLVINTGGKLVVLDTGNGITAPGNRTVSRTGRIGSISGTTNFFSTIMSPNLKPGGERSGLMKL